MWCPTLPPCNLCADAELPASSSPLLIQYGKREEASSSASAQTEGGGVDIYNFPMLVFLLLPLSLTILSWTPSVQRKLLGDSLSQCTKEAGRFLKSVLSYSTQDLYMHNSK